MDQSQNFEKTLDFLKEIGIETAFENVPVEACFVPGLMIKDGRIVIDQQALKYPGDILHEAAHIAVVPAAERRSLCGAVIKERKDAPAEEMMAIAWSYAACIHLQIDPAFVFHNDGYSGGGASIIENFGKGNHFGVPVLQWLGMTATSGASIYPKMIRWMRD